MKIALGCDHGGLDLKNKIIEFLKSEGHEIIDEGTYTYDSCDQCDKEHSRRNVMDLPKE